MSKNFTDAWNRAKGKGSNLSRNHDFKNPPPGLTKKLSGTSQRAQIVRTQPEEKEKTIKRLYQQATSFARQYIYVENQYFQYTEWATGLKDGRASFVKGWQAAGKSPADLPNLHVMIVTPTPERPQMVPRTYDTVKALGQGTSMPNQDKSVEDELARHSDQTARWNDHVKSQQAKGELPDPDMYPAPLSPAAQSAQEVGSKGNIAKSMESMGLRSLVGSLWSFDNNWRTSPSNRSVLEQQARWDEHVKSQTAKGEAPDPDVYPALPPTATLMAARYREIYIHSKLMVIDDSFFTLGSANLNLRSMAVDAEINVGSDDVGKSKDLRQRVWKLHSGNAANCGGGDGSPRAISDTFKSWRQLMTDNASARTKGDATVGFLIPFHDTRTSNIRLS